MIGVGSSVYPPPKDLLIHLNLSMVEYRQHFNSFANNWRFCLFDTRKNLGTQTLKALRHEAPKEWERKYGNILTHLITFVGAGKDGGVYRADNWKLIGQTAGLPKHKAVSMKWDTDIGSKFVKPDGKNKKLIFIVKI